MREALDKFKTQVIDDILHAPSQQEVQATINAAIATLQEGKVEEKMIHEFVDMISYQLQWFSPMNKDAQQWSNITTARVMLNRWKQAPSSFPNLNKDV
jgi:hypothetical protein